MRLAAIGALVGVLGVARQVRGEPALQSEHANDRFGSAVAIDGDRLAVGAPGSNDKSFDAGAVHMYERSGDGWRLDAVVQADAPVAYGRFGAFLALSGDVLAVAAPVDPATYSVDDRRGRAYMFDRTGGAWTQRAVVLLEDVDADDFGVAAALGTTRAAFSATQRRRGAALLGGVVVVVARDGDAWAVEQRLERDVAGFGFMVAMDDEFLLVTGYEDSAYAYRREGSKWVGGAAIVMATEPAIWTIRLAGETLVVGSSGGSALKFFERAGDAWGLAQTLELGRALASYDALAVHGGRAAVGVDGEDDEAVVVLERVDGAWAEVATIASPHPPGSAFGQALWLGEEHLAVGVPAHGEFAHQNVGEVRVYAAPAWDEEDVLAPGVAEQDGCGCRGGGSLPGWCLLVLVRRRRR